MIYTINIMIDNDEKIPPCYMHNQEIKNSIYEQVKKIRGVVRIEEKSGNEKVFYGKPDFATGECEGESGQEYNWKVVLKNKMVDLNEIKPQILTILKENGVIQNAQ